MVWLVFEYKSSQCLKGCMFSSMVKEETYEKVIAKFHNYATNITSAMKDLILKNEVLEEENQELVRKLIKSEHMVFILEHKVNLLRATLQMEIRSYDDDDDAMTLATKALDQSMERAEKACF